MEKNDDLNETCIEKMSSREVEGKKKILFTIFWNKKGWNCLEKMTVC